MDEIIVNRSRTKILRLAVREAIDEGTRDSLGVEIMDAFTESQIEDIDAHLDGVSFEDVIEETLDEWGGEEEEELLELLEARFGEMGMELKFWYTDEAIDDEDEDEEYSDDAYDDKEEEDDFLQQEDDFDDEDA